jgi:hypothetical protein
MSTNVTVRWRIVPTGAAVAASLLMALTACRPAPPSNPSTLMHLESFDVMCRIEREQHDGWTYTNQRIESIAQGSFAEGQSVTLIYPDESGFTAFANTLGETQSSFYCSDSQVMISRYLPSNYNLNECLGSYDFRMLDTVGDYLSATDSVEAAIGSAPMIVSPIPDSSYLDSDPLDIDWTIPSTDGISCFAVLAGSPNVEGLFYAGIVPPSTTEFTVPSGTLPAGTECTIAVLAFDKSITSADLISLMNMNRLYGAYSVMSILGWERASDDYDFITGSSLQIYTSSVAP